MSELNKLKEAAHLIEDMTGCRFKSSYGVPFIYPDRDKILAVNMRKETDFNAKLHRIHFEANLLTMGKPMDADGLAKLQCEVGQVYALLAALETQEYALTPDEMYEFGTYIRDLERMREEQEQEQTQEPEPQEQTQGPVMGQSFQ